MISCTVLGSEDIKTIPTCPGEAHSGAVISLLGNQGAKVTLDLGLNHPGPMWQDLTPLEKLPVLECLAHLSSREDKDLSWRLAAFDPTRGFTLTRFLVDGVHLQTWGSWRSRNWLLPQGEHRKGLLTEIKLPWFSELYFLGVLYLLFGLIVWSQTHPLSWYTSSGILALFLSSDHAYRQKS